MKRSTTDSEVDKRVAVILAQADIQRHGGQPAVALDLYDQAIALCEKTYTALLLMSLPPYFEALYTARALCNEQVKAGFLPYYHLEKASEYAERLQRLQKT